MIGDLDWKSGYFLTRHYLKEAEHETTFLVGGRHGSAAL